MNAAFYERYVFEECVAFSSYALEEAANNIESKKPAGFRVWMSSLPFLNVLKTSFDVVQVQLLQNTLLNLFIYGRQGIDFCVGGHFAADPVHMSLVKCGCCWFFYQAADGSTGGAATQSGRRKRKGRNDDELSEEEDGVSATGASEEEDDDSDESGACSWPHFRPTHDVIYVRRMW